MHVEATHSNRNSALGLPLPAEEVTWSIVSFAECELLPGQILLPMIATGPLNEIASLIEASPSVLDERDVRKRSPLVVATVEDRLDLVELFLERYKVNIDEPDIDGCTALMYALSARLLDISRALVSAGADTKWETIDALGEPMLSPLSMACLGGIPELALMVSPSKRDMWRSRSGLRQLPIFTTFIFDNLEFLQWAMSDDLDILKNDPNLDVLVIRECILAGAVNSLRWLLDEKLTNVEISSFIFDGDVTPLQAASANGASKMLRFLLEELHLPPTEARVGNSNPPIRHAVCCDKLICYEILKAAGNIDVNHVNSNSGQSLMGDAVIKSKPRMIRKLLSDGFKLQEDRGYLAVKVIHFADFECFKILADAGMDMNFQHNSPYNTLWLTIHSVKADIAELVYRLPSSLPAHSHIRPDGTNLFLAVVQAGFLELAQLVYHDYPAQTTSTNRNGQNAADLALIYGRWNVSKWLAKKGISHSSNLDLQLALNTACTSGNFEAVNHLMDLGGLPAGRNGPNDNTSPLYAAAEAGQLEIVKHLLSLPEVKAHSANLALLVAIWKGQLDVVKFLCQAGGSVNDPRHHNKALHMAVESKSPQMLQYLLDNHLDVLDIDVKRDGRTPLIQALLSGFHIGARKLIDAGASEDSKADLAKAAAKSSVACLKFLQGRNIDLWPSLRPSDTLPIEEAVESLNARTFEFLLQLMPLQGSNRLELLVKLSTLAASKGCLPILQLIEAREGHKAEEIFTPAVFAAIAPKSSTTFIWFFSGGYHANVDPVDIMKALVQSCQAFEMKVVKAAFNASLPVSSSLLMELARAIVSSTSNSPLAVYAMKWLASRGVNIFDLGTDGLAPDHPLAHWLNSVRSSDE